MSERNEDKIFFFVMAKITLSGILAILKLILRLIAKCIQLAGVIRDLCDDGFLNHSVQPSKASLIASEIIDSLNDFTNKLFDFETELFNELEQCDSPE